MFLWILDMLQYRSLPFQRGMNHSLEGSFDGVMVFSNIGVWQIYREIPIYKKHVFFETAITSNE